ncbi:MAG: AsmA family protein, partial [gamma proteobacterium symbiont of Bathyaustriella thionipta]|nr:AsmA family protein [gamma proteobacterium symbiont of Bathyaustriella thionipta]
KQPRFNISKRVNNFQLGPMLTDLTGKDTLTGTAQMKADLTSMGSTPDSMKRALNGTLDFTFKNGAIKGINLAQMIRDAKASLGMGKASKSKEAPQTDFSEIIGHAKITQGVVNNDVLKIKSPYLRAGGQGTANLVSEQLDYKIKTTLVKSDTGQGGGDLKDLQGVPIPMHYKGSFEQISNFKNWSIDMQDVAVQKGKQELEKAISDKLLGKPGKDKKDSKSGDLGGLLKDKLKF